MVNEWEGLNEPQKNFIGYSMACGLTFYDVAKYFIMWHKIFYQKDKGLKWKQLLFFELYFFVQMIKFATLIWQGFERCKP
jgi:hypothetical protein